MTTAEKFKHQQLSPKFEGVLFYYFLKKHFYGLRLTIEQIQESDLPKLWMCSREHNGSHNYPTEFKCAPMIPVLRGK